MLFFVLLRVISRFRVSSSSVCSAVTDSSNHGTRGTHGKNIAFSKSGSIRRQSFFSFVLVHKSIADTANGLHDLRVVGFVFEILSKADDKVVDRTGVGVFL